MIIKLPFDRKEKDFLKFLDLVKNEGSVLDIGANIGVMTYHFSKKLNNTRIYAFEPIPLNYEVLKRVVKKFKLNNVITYPLALGDSAGQIKMLMPEKGNVYLHGLSHVIDENQKARGLEFNVSMQKLDAIEELKEETIHAIKIDVENFEFKVIKGAEQLIRKKRPFIYTELWDSENRTQCLKFLSELNYKVFINNKNKLIEFHNQDGIQNFFFIPYEHCERLKL